LFRKKRHNGRQSMPSRNRRHRLRRVVVRGRKLCRRLAVDVDGVRVGTMTEEHNHAVMGAGARRRVQRRVAGGVNAVHAAAFASGPCARDTGGWQVNQKHTAGAACSIRNQWHAPGRSNSVWICVWEEGGTPCCSRKWSTRCFRRSTAL